MPRNLVVFSDGTGQDGGSERNTNVYKLFNMVEDRTADQVCFYDPGVGSTGTVSKIPGLASGRGFGKNVRDCYTWLFENYMSGDRISLIGFSRGAATVRSLASFIHMFGIMPRSRRSLVEQAWRIYTTRDPKKRKAQAEKFIAYHRTIWTKVHFLGCYDTVAALGMPYQWASKVLDRVPGMKHRFHDFRLSPAVVHAYHALALDDQRKTFHPVLWNPLEDEAADPTGKERGVDALACETMRQVWFAGMHTDVGGGYEEQTLSDIPLVWLARRAAEHGLRIWPDHRVTIEEDENGVMHDSRAKGWTRLYRRARRTWDESRGDRPVVHESAMLRLHAIDNTPVTDPTDERRYQAWITQYGAQQEPWERYDARTGLAAPAAEQPRVTSGP